LKPFHFGTFQNLSKKLPFWNPCPFHFGTPIYIDLLIPLKELNYERYRKELTAWKTRKGGTKKGRPERKRRAVTTASITRSTSSASEPPRRPVKVP